MDDLTLLMYVAGGLLLWTFVPVVAHFNIRPAGRGQAARVIRPGVTNDGLGDNPLLRTGGRNRVTAPELANMLDSGFRTMRLPGADHDLRRCAGAYDANAADRDRLARVPAMRDDEAVGIVGVDECGDRPVEYNI